MSLISPSNLQYVISLSLCSRLLVLTIQYLSNVLIDDHYADAYRNKYHKILYTNTSIQYLLPESYRYSYNCIEGLTKWDAQYFLEIANDGYVSEQHLAFLPLYPIVVSLVKQFLFEHTRVHLDHLSIKTTTTTDFRSEETITIKALEDYIRAAIVGSALNNFVFFPIACISLFALTKIIKNGNDKYARNVIWWFCFNPASVFFSACYSESLFAALTFTALLTVEYRSHIYSTSHQDLSTSTTQVNTFVPLSQLNRLIYVSLPSLAPLALASAARSNGLVNIGFLAYQFLLKYLTLIHARTDYWSFIAYLSVLLECVQDVLVLVMSSVIAASGYVTFQIYSYIKFCANHPSRQKGVMQMKPEWCNNPIPHSYGYVQAKYWNVGLLQYYELKQLPNFLLAIPMSYLILIGSLSSLRLTGQSQKGKKQLAYYLQGICLTLLCSLSINIQVITRLLASACPVVYWICADYYDKSRPKGKILVTYFATYFVIGTILHVNFFPWT